MPFYPGAGAYRGKMKGGLSYGGSVYRGKLKQGGGFICQGRYWKRRGKEVFRRHVKMFKLTGYIMYLMFDFYIINTV
jgi:hypothetical protein